jgi:hypothetical protein
MPAKLFQSYHHNNLFKKEKKLYCILVHFVVLGYNPNLSLDGVTREVQIPE